MEQEIFEKEMDMCRKLSQENGGGCNWGKCRDCGVVPLLYKLHKGKILESKEEIESAKKENGIIF